MILDVIYIKVAPRPPSQIEVPLLGTGKETCSKSLQFCRPTKGAASVEEILFSLGLYASAAIKPLNGLAKKSYVLNKSTVWPMVCHDPKLRVSP